MSYANGRPAGGGGMPLPYHSPTAVQSRRDLTTGNLDAQHANQGLEADQAQFSRGQSQQDNDQEQGNFTGLLAAVKGYTNPGGSTASSGSNGGGSVGPGGTWTAGSPVAPVAPVDTSAAQSAAFARAKDKVGQTSSGALAGLRSSLGGRGMLGSGAESRGTASVINRGQGELGDVARSQAMTEADLAQKTATTNYEGGITQRGQDTGAAVATRGQDIGRYESDADRAASTQRGNLDAILGLYNSFKNRGTGGPGQRY